jgi:hypothetical protein
MQSSLERNITSQLGFKREDKFLPFPYAYYEREILQQMFNLILPFDKSSGAQSCVLCLKSSILNATSTNVNLF